MRNIAGAAGDDGRIDVTAELKRRGTLLLDAAMGTALMAAGQPAGMNSAEMNITAPETVMRVHMANIAAGADAVTANTFGATALYIKGEKALALRTVEEGVRIAREAAEAAGREAAGRGAGAGRIAVALDIGPAGCLLGELGDVSYDEAEAAFYAQAEAGARRGADLALLETFADIQEFVRAARAAKSAGGLPVFGTMAFGAGGRTFMGAAPADFVRAARSAGVSAVGANCGVAPSEMAAVIECIAAEAGELPVIAQPNAGLPEVKNGKTVYGMSAEAFAEGAEILMRLGARVIGGCCGTTPEMIAALRVKIDRGDAPAGVINRSHVPPQLL